jgi:hypothetical protein
MHAGKSIARGGVLTAQRSRDDLVVKPIVLSATRLSPQEPQWVRSFVVPDAPIEDVAQLKTSRKLTGGIRLGVLDNSSPTPTIC